MKFNKKFFKNSVNKNLFFYLFLLAYSVLLLLLCFKIQLWVDETFTLNTTSGNFFDVVIQSYNFEGQPPVYFILLSLWRDILPNVFFAKLFSVLCIAFSAFFLYKLAKLLADSECSKWLVVIFLLNPFTVWAALEIRLYALLICFSTISIYFFFQYYLNQKNKYLYLFLVISLVGLYTQYFFALQIAALAFSILIFKGWKSFFKLCLYLIPVVFLFLPNLLYMPEQLSIIKPRNLVYTTIERINIVLHTPQDFMLALQLVPFERWIKWGIKISFFIAILIAYYKLLKNRNSSNYAFQKIINNILIALIILVVLFCVMAAITGILYSNKYMAIAFPFFILLFLLLKTFSPINRNLIYSIISIYFILLLMSFYRYPVKGYNYKEIGKYVRSIERKNEPILFYSNALSLTFRYYYSGHNPIEPLPHEVKFDSSFMESLKDTFELKQSINKIKTSSNSYLFISDLTESQYVVELSRGAVDSFLNNNYNITLDTILYGRTKNFPLRIRRIEKRN